MADRGAGAALEGLGTARDRASACAARILGVGARAHFQFNGNAPKRASMPARSPDMLAGTSTATGSDRGAASARGGAGGGVATPLDMASACAMRISIAARDDATGGVTNADADAGSVTLSLLLSGRLSDVLLAFDARSSSSSNGGRGRVPGARGDCSLRSRDATCRARQPLRARAQDTHVGGDQSVERAGHKGGGPLLRRGGRLGVVNLVP